MPKPLDDVEPGTPANGRSGYAAYYAPQLAAATANVAALPPAHRALFEREVAAFMREREPDGS